MRLQNAHSDFLYPPLTIWQFYYTSFHLHDNSILFYVCVRATSSWSRRSVYVVPVFFFDIRFSSIPYQRLLL